ncbi:MAG: hypothetical protein L6R38_006520 [Xanthoria sp. 2 TBL-2021]|nr:MAG: hypothetical protein L6R38_006520 [Xanthoria sp. 2 TBL-2021]
MILRLSPLTLFLTAIVFAIAHDSDLDIAPAEHQARNVDEQQLPPHSRGTWLGWGAGIYNDRRASPDARVNSVNVASLHQTCQKVYGNGESNPPLVVDGTAYYPTWDGLFVALDYTNCKVLWQTNITRLINQYSSKYYDTLYPISRTTPALYKNILFIGTQANALLLAINKRNGKLVDTIQVSDHPLAIVTQSPTVWQGRIFVGSSSSEETGADTIPGYECCSFIATMNGFTFRRNRFQLLWSQPMIPDGLNFTGAAIWGSQPSIDPTRNQVFIATGNVYTVPESYDICSNKTVNANTTSTNPGNATDPCAPKEVYQEAILAFNTVTGDINWSHQLSPIDAWNVACTGVFPGGGLNPGACPPNPGPDADFGMAPTFVPGSTSTPSKEDTLIIGQKNGNLYALSASDGKLFWALATSPTGFTGGLIWAVAVDDTAVYYTAVNSQRKPWKLQSGTSLSNSAFGAATLKNGTILWETPSPGNSTTAVQPTVANDVVLVGVGGPAPYTGPGSFLALNKYTGKIIRETRLGAEYFQAGIAVVQDYVMFGTGYGYGLLGKANGTFNVWRLSK